MKLLNNFLATINRYRNACLDQSIIDSRIKELFDKEKLLTTKEALIGYPDLEGLKKLSHIEKINLLHAMLVQRLSENKDVSDLIEAIELITCTNTTPSN